MGRTARHLERGRRIAVARTAGAVIISVAVTTEVPPCFLVCVAGR